MKYKYIFGSMEVEEKSKISENPSSDEPLTHLKTYVGHSMQIVFIPLKNACLFFVEFF